MWSWALFELRAPSIWFRFQKNAGYIFLLPLSWIFLGLGWLRRMWARPLALDVPVISVGNLVMGGAGKTPVAMALADFFKKQGLKPVFISRGYGRWSEDALWVDPSVHTFKDVGDESLLLAKKAPTLVLRHLKNIGQHLQSAPGLVLILDDGHQQTQLKCWVNMLVVDAWQGFGNQRVFPLGPLREALEKGMRRAHGLIVVGENNTGGSWRGKPVLSARPVHHTPLKKGKRVWGVAGLGYPDKFRYALDAQGLEVVGFSVFPDHHPYTLLEVQALQAKAKASSATLITTAKDLIRWPIGIDLPEVLDLEIHVDNHLLIEFFKHFNVFDMPFYKETQIERPVSKV